MVVDEPLHLPAYEVLIVVREPRTQAYGTVAVFKDLIGNLWYLIPSITNRHHHQRAPKQRSGDPGPGRHKRPTIPRHGPLSDRFLRKNFFQNGPGFVYIVYRYETPQLMFSLARNHPRLLWAMAGVQILGILWSLALGAPVQQFDCVLAVSSSDLLVGQYPDLKVTLRNRTQKSVLAVGSFGWLEIVDSQGNPVFSERLRCGVEDCPRAEELAVIGGDQELNPFGEGFPVTRYLDHSQISRPGEYQLCYHYTTTRGLADYLKQERGTANPLKLLLRVAHVFHRILDRDLKSNVIRVRFRPRLSPEQSSSATHPFCACGAAVT